jgi:hypothetical protein
MPTVTSMKIPIKGQIPQAQEVAGDVPELPPTMDLDFQREDEMLRAARPAIDDRLSSNNSLVIDAGRGMALARYSRPMWIRRPPITAISTHGMSKRKSIL